jgi:hypothetical protein
VNARVVATYCRLTPGWEPPFLTLAELSCGHRQITDDDCPASLGSPVVCAFCVDGKRRRGISACALCLETPCRCARTVRTFVVERTELVAGVPETYEEEFEQTSY